MGCAAVVLAAGRSSRFGGPKLRAPFRGRPLLAWSLAAAAGSDPAELLVVVGNDDLSDVVAATSGAPADRPPTVVRNPDPDRGLASSLAVAVAAARLGGHDALVFGLGDTPLVPAEAWRRVGESGADLAVARFGDDLRPPVRVAASLWDELPTVGDVGARALLRRRPDLAVQVPCPGDPVDVDTPEDLRSWS